MPPRSPPLPGPALVRKNVMLFCCACAVPLKPSANSAAAAPVQRFTVLFIERPPIDPFPARRIVRLAPDHKPRHRRPYSRPVHILAIGNFRQRPGGDRAFAAAATR